MKKVILFVFAVTMVSFLSAQTIVFQEGFETNPSFTTTADSAGFPTANFKAWAITSHLYKSGVKSDSNTLQAGKTIYLTSNSFSTAGYPYAYLEFSHICKLYFLDGGNIEVSNDNGLTWTSLSIIQYQGTATFIVTGGIYKYCESSYTDWIAGDTITKPTNLWWKNEKFDISSIAANKANVKIRFTYSSTGNLLGYGRYGWLLDDIKVTLNTVIGIEEFDMNKLWLGQNTPNPTNGLTCIEYNLPNAGEIKFDIINLFGQKVYSIAETEMAGKHKVNIDLNKLADGIYYYTLEFKGKRLNKKMLINK
ncbi:MAG: T9SS type A sorting domain-containing protein [Bacteroidetes bacterium]|nr:T9SS type A sorting domain-containing protein [Bacteroidota bacterium]